MTAPPPPIADQPGDGIIRVGLASDLHLELEGAYRDQLLQRSRRGDASDVIDAMALIKALRNEPGHPVVGPDLRDLKAAGIDLLLLPGDIDSGVAGVAWAEAAARYLGCPAYYGLGNHEAYGEDITTLPTAIWEAARKTEGRVIFLENQRVDITIRCQRVAILGATLWSDYGLNGNPEYSAQLAQWQLTDHRVIRYGREPFTPEHALVLHRESRAWLDREARKAHEEADMVILMTHHAPVAEAIPPRYEGGDLSPAFASDLRAEILAWDPDVWTWGHTHHSMSSEIGRTKLVSAQRGYIGVEPVAEHFKPLVLDLRVREPEPVLALGR